MTSVVYAVDASNQAAWEAVKKLIDARPGQAIRLTREEFLGLRRGVIALPWPEQESATECEWCAVGNEPINGVHKIDRGLQYLVCTSAGASEANSGEPK